MAAKRSKLQREQDLVLEAEMYLQGKTLLEIGQRVGVSYVQVHKDLNEVRRRWRETSVRDFDAIRDEQLAKLDKLEATYWDGWARSIAVKKKESSERRTGTGESGRPVEINKAQIVREERVGDPRFLDGVQRVIERRCKLMGLDAPEKIEHTGTIYAIQLPEDFPDADENPNVGPNPD